MNNGKMDGHEIEKLKKLKRFKKVLSVSMPLLGIASVLVLILMVTLVLWERVLPVFTTSSMVGVETIYDDTELVEDLNNSISNWNGDEKLFFSEAQKQKKIWVDDYEKFNIPQEVVANYNNNDLDLVKVVVPVQYQGAINLYAFDQDFSLTNRVIDEDGTMLNDYEGEPLVYNRDTRDYYKQAGERLGSTLLLFPNMRMMLGNFISAKISYKYIKYDDGRESGYTNLPEILSDWSIVSKMYSQSEEGAKSPYHSPVTASSNVDLALSTGYDRCKNLDLDTWTIKNSCRDYDLILSENSLSLPSNYKGSGNLEMLLDEKFKDKQSADIPPYYVDKDGIKNWLEHGEWYYAVRVSRQYDEDMYKEFLKKVYIPSLFPTYDADKIYLEMEQFEQVYRYYNDNYMMNLSGGNGSVIGGGTHSVPNVEYKCANGKLPNLASYPGHGGVDINGVPIGTTVYPLFSGTVYSVSNDNSNCYPRVNAAGGYTCGHCSGTGYGNLVVIKGTAENGEEYYAYYGHLSGISVSVGQSVDVNTKIGAVGNTGCSTGAHLHLELRKTSDGSKVFANTIYNNTAVAGVLCSRTGREI